MALTAPSGTYKGTNKVLGFNIAAQVVVDSATAADILVDVTGADTMHVDCKAESYTLNGNDIHLNDVDKQGDCLHDKLAEKSVSLKSATYDPDQDSITLKIKKSFLSIEIILTKAGMEVKMINLMALTAPSGTYK